MTPSLREGITELADAFVYVDALERAHRVGAQQAAGERPNENIVGRDAL